MGVIPQQSSLLWDHCRFYTVGRLQNKNDNKQGELEQALIKWLLVMLTISLGHSSVFRNNKQYSFTYG
ncbi:hypothetical protein [Leuconostoc gasicomitatum]|uniref:hypothetical protein n=1 Tax=Leuconostoc gasicomitatum TaxID=115778 RepID=UPI001CC5045D|nr:hypothetical protein [Leuconostoc gasicomitatum]MBZ5969281.1 hypothetical protein [Leuconostoc gasicomitatum]MBZ5988853.1 hypothetical protein [Leuconostoc gasicomitatum]MBZ5990725.1 hypothetical protein [Leuconostoc gasicomitatum]